MDQGRNEGEHSKMRLREPDSSGAPRPRQEATTEGKGRDTEEVAPPLLEEKTTPAREVGNRV